jgi:hypothetical protein
MINASGEVLKLLWNLMFMVMGYGCGLILSFTEVFEC